MSNREIAQRLLEVSNGLAISFSLPMAERFPHTGVIMKELCSPGRWDIYLTAVFRIAAFRQRSPMCTPETHRSVVAEAMKLLSEESYSFPLKALQDGLRSCDECEQTEPDFPIVAHLGEWFLWNVAQVPLSEPERQEAISIGLLAHKAMEDWYSVCSRAA